RPLHGRRDGRGRRLRARRRRRGEGACRRSVAGRDDRPGAGARPPRARRPPGADVHHSRVAPRTSDAGGDGAPVRRGEGTGAGRGVAPLRGQRLRRGSRPASRRADRGPTPRVSARPRGVGSPGRRRHHLCGGRSGAPDLRSDPDPDRDRGPGRRPPQQRAPGRDDPELEGPGAGGRRAPVLRGETGRGRFPPRGVPAMNSYMTIGTWIRDRGRLTPERTAIDFCDRTVTYGELDRDSSRLAAELMGRGLGRGDRVAVLADNCPEYVTLFFACAKAGLVMTPLNWRLAPPELAYQVDHSGASVLLASRSRLEQAEQVVAEAEHRPPIRPLEDP